MRNSNWTRRLPLWGGVFIIGVFAWLSFKYRPEKRVLESRQQQQQEGQKPSQVLAISAVSKKTVTAKEIQTSLSTEKAKVLDQVLKAHNDNDPRLDRELRTLNEDDKQAFRTRYESMPAEMLNERGTIVFLLGRNITTQQDFDFLARVVSEPPCQSLTNCKASAEESAKHDHHAGINQITLNYPQLNALQALSKAPSEFEDQSRRFIEQQGQSASSQVVQAMARRALSGRAN